MSSVTAQSLRLSRDFSFRIFMPGRWSMTQISPGIFSPPLMGKVWSMVSGNTQEGSVEAC